jgi:hypothetical protein
MARVLGEGGLEEEARAALLEALVPLGRALAIENRLPEPGTPKQALVPPLAICWKDALAPLRQFSCDVAAPWRPLAESLSSL